MKKQSLHIFIDHGISCQSHPKLTLAIFRIVFILILGTAPVFADQVFLRNGDILTGDIVKKETDKLIFKTSYAGNIEIQWSEVLNVLSDSPEHVVLSDGSNLRGVLIQAEEGVVKLQPANTVEPNEFDLRETKYINPSPALTGEGIVWSGNINAGLTLTGGNSNTQAARVDIQTVARALKNRYTVGGLLNWSEDSGTDNQFNSRVNAQYDHFYTPRRYGYTNIALENDRFRDLKLRNNMGLGTGYQVFETPNLNLALEGGLNYIVQDYYVASDEDYAALRWAVKFNQLWFAGTTRFFHEHEVLYGFSSQSETLFYSKTGLRFPLLFNFNATAQLNYNWDSRPANGRKKDDSTLLFTLGYGW